MSENANPQSQPNTPVNPFSTPVANEQTAAAAAAVPAVPAGAASSQQAAPAAGGENPALAQAIAQLSAVLGKNTGNGENTDPAAQAGATGEFGDLNTFDIEGISNPAIRSMAYVLASSNDNLDLNRALGNALDRFDPTLVDSRYIREIVKDPQKADHIERIAKSIVEAASNEADTITNTVFSMAGGEEGWNVATAVWNKSAPEALRNVVKTMIDSGKPEQIKAGAELIVEFGKNSGQIQIKGTSVKAGGVAAGNAANGLSKVQFQEELRKLDPYSRGYMEAREELFARRRLGTQLGL